MYMAVYVYDGDCVFDMLILQTTIANACPQAVTENAHIDGNDGDARVLLSRSSANHF